MSTLFPGSLTNRSQSVVLSGEISGPLPVTSGVPQGSVLVFFLLFLLYVNDVNNVSLSGSSKLILYADDIIAQNEEDYTALQQDVDSLGVWSLLNRLSFNNSTIVPTHLLFEHST